MGGVRCYGLLMHRTPAVLLAMMAAVALAACGSSSATEPTSVPSTTSATHPSPAPAVAVIDGDPLTLKTPQGIVHGSIGDSARQFQGIPFAAPPVGALRWQAPQPATPWASTLEATRLSNLCPQIIPIINAYEGNEDCLYANVFAPAGVPSAPRPVMVWIYGGGFTVGSAGDNSAANYAAKHNLVSVSFNYRLGSLGFLALPALAAENPTHSTGNLGLLDQQAALRWVRDNIAAYGGDPNQVTIFGESAGGMSVCVHLVSKAAAGLFERAITQSGPCTLPAEPLATAETQGATLGAAVGCPSGSDQLACMRTKPAEQMIQTLPSDPSFLFGDGSHWGPVADGVTVPVHATALLTAGRFHRVPVIVGANRDEGRLFVALHQLELGTPLTAAAWAGQVDAYFGPTVGPLVRKRYPLADYPDAGAAFGQAVGDAVLACPSVATAQILRRWVPVYEYEFDYASNPFILGTPGVTLGAFHSAELPYVFQRTTETSGNFTFTPTQEQLATTISGAWARFGATGDPSGAGLNWPRLTSPSGSYLILDSPTSVAKAMKASQCTFWASTRWSVTGTHQPPSATTSTT